MTQWVYGFGGGSADGDASMKNLLGGKGANLAEMSSLGLPVPPGFTITTEVCTHYYANGETYPADLEAQVKTALDQGRGDRRQDLRRCRTTRCWSRSVRAPAPRCRA
jgi:pyruvate, orthophosphate dikinase